MADKPTIQLTFAEATAYFRDKINLPTATWTDVYSAEHDLAFMVAGAIKDDLIQDFRNEIDKAIAQGTGYGEFRKSFKQIVKKHGWSYNGGEGWRSRVIYNTNMQGAYMAGRYQQMLKVAKQRPYWEYHHSDLVADPRPEHLSWDGLVLRYDDSWWQTHYPPNGWGCKCKVYARSERDLTRLKLTVANQSPSLNIESVTVGIRGPSPRVVDVPAGIDPGFEHAPGASRLTAAINRRLEQIRKLPADIAAAELIKLLDNLKNKGLL